MYTLKVICCVEYSQKECWTERHTSSSSSSIGRKYTYLWPNCPRGGGSSGRILVFHARALCRNLIASTFLAFSFATGKFKMLGWHQHCQGLSPQRLRSPTSCTSMAGCLRSSRQLGRCSLLPQGRHQWPQHNYFSRQKKKSSQRWASNATYPTSSL